MDESEAGSVSDFARPPFASFSEAPAYTQCRYDLPSGDQREFSRGGPTPPCRALAESNPPAQPATAPSRPTGPIAPGAEISCELVGRRKRLPHNMGQTLSSVNPAIPVSVPQNGCEHPLPMGYNP